MSNHTKSSIHSTLKSCKQNFHEAVHAIHVKLLSITVLCPGLYRYWLNCVQMKRSQLNFHCSHANTFNWVQVRIVHWKLLEITEPKLWPCTLTWHVVDNNSGINGFPNDYTQTASAIDTRSQFNINTDGLTLECGTLFSLMVAQLNTNRDPRCLTSVNEKES